VEGLEDRTAPALVTFTNPAGGDWSVASNWSTGALPADADDVVIDQPGVTVTHEAGADTIKSLTLSDPLALTGGSLALRGPSLLSPTTSTLHQPLSVSGGSLALTNQTLTADGLGGLTDAADGAVTVTNTTVNAPLANDGLLVVQGNYNTFGAAFRNAAGATLRVQGTDPFGAGILKADGFTNAGSLELASTSPLTSAILTVSAGVLTNTGTLRVLAGGALRILNAQLDNQGTFTVGADTSFLVRGASSNSGTLSVTGGTLRLNVLALGPTFTNADTGLFSIDSGATLEINNSLLTNLRAGVLTGGSYTVAGTFRLADAALTANAAMLVLDGPDARVVDQSDADALAHLARNTADGFLAVIDGAAVHTAGDFVNTGFVLVGGGGTFAVGGDYTQVADGSTFLRDGTLAGGTVHVLGGAFVGFGVVNANVVNAAEVLLGDLFTPGSLTINGDYTQTADGVLVVKVGGYAAGNEFDQLVVRGHAALDGTLEVNLDEDFVPATGDTFAVVAAGTADGAFTELTADGDSFDQVNDGMNLNLVSH
jgi:fibronectin-binding autotransporter adhesin